MPRRRYYDLCILYDPSNINMLLQRVKACNYKGVAVCFHDPEVARAVEPQLRELEDSFHLRIAIRYEVEARTRSELLRMLRRRERHWVVAVTPRGLEAARVAARDRRVDIITIEPFSEFIDETEVRMAAEHSKVFEVSLSHLLSGYDHLASALPALRKRVLRAAKRSLVLVSSRAYDPLQVRNPRDLAAFSTLLGLNREQALDAVSRIPESILATKLGNLGA